MKIYHIKNKQVIAVKNKSGEFLKAYSSNTLDKPRNAFVDIHGKIVAVFDQKVITTDEIWIVIERQFLDRLKRHLEKYLSLSGTTLSAINLSVYYDLESDLAAEKGDVIISQKIGRLVLTSRQIDPNVTDGEFTKFRLKNDLPLQGVDYDEELILNVADEEFVSYTKGCYLGQEIIARVHHRSKPPKKLTVKFKNKSSQEEYARMTSKVTDPSTGSELGFLFSSNL